MILEFKILCLHIFCSTLTLWNELATFQSQVLFSNTPVTTNLDIMAMICAAKWAGIDKILTVSRAILTAVHVRADRRCVKTDS